MSELHSKSMVAQSRREWIVSSVILALTEKQVERLGVSAIGDRVRLRLLCRNFEENSAGTSTGSENVARELRCNLGGQSKIYLRPIQRNLSTKSLISQNYYEVKERCISC